MSIILGRFTPMRQAFVPAAASLMLALGILTSPAHGQVLISEIMYNPASKEGHSGNESSPAHPTKVEWVELYNAGDEPVDLAGCMLKDEDGQTQAIPQGVTIKPGEAVVLIPGKQTVTGFREAWGNGFTVIPLDGWERPGLSNLANNPSEDNEQLTFCNADGEVLDAVNYDDESPWPSDEPHGPSIVLQPGHFSAEGNDAGDAWASAVEGQLGARFAKRTDDFRDDDLGSPGTVILDMPDDTE